MPPQKSRAHELALVMPIYNEEGCIDAVLRDWRDMLATLGVDFRIVALNDGSTDGTAQALAAFADDERIEVVRKPNGGHGPTVLMGYRKASELAEWVFQCDSDDEIRPDAFPQLWRVRQHYDALFGVRQGRAQGAGRRLITTVARLTVRLFFGPGIPDVNTPYRLMRAELLRQIIDQIPDGTFAPNVVVSGAFAKAGARVYNHSVPFQSRRTGTTFLRSWRMWPRVLKAFWQTVRCRPSLPPCSGQAQRSRQTVETEPISPRGN